MKRYDLEEKGPGGMCSARMLTTEQGDWVRFSDARERLSVVTEALINEHTHPYPYDNDGCPVCALIDAARSLVAQP